MVIVSDLADNGVIYTRFSDIRDAQQAYKCLPQVQIGWFVKHIDLDEFIRCSSPEELGNTSFFEAQVLVTARCSGSRDNFDPSIVSNQLMTILRKFGDILSCVAEGTLFPLLSFRVEFCDSHDAEAATLELDGTRLAGLHLTTTAASVRNAYGPLIIGDDESLVEKQLAGFNLGGHSALQRVQFPLASGSAGSSYPRKIGHTLGADFVANPHPHQLQSPLHGFSIQGVSSVPLLPWGYRPGVVGQERFARARSSPVVSQQHYSPKSNNRMGPEYTSGHHNVVDVERIRQGLDVRTTVCILP